MLTNPPILYDFCVGAPISHLLTMGSTPVYHSVLNVKALVGTFNQEKALVGAFSVIVQPVVEPMEQHTALLLHSHQMHLPPTRTLTVIMINLGGVNFFFHLWSLFHNETICRNYFLVYSQNQVGVGSWVPF